MRAMSEVRGQLRVRWHGVLGERFSWAQGSHADRRWPDTLPWLRGYGNVKSLHVAYQESPALRAAASMLMTKDWDGIIAGFGNASLSTAYTGTTSTDSLDGGTGADRLSGGAGNDTYCVDNASDIVDESCYGDGQGFGVGDMGGIDTIISSLTISLADRAHVKGLLDNLTLIGTENLGGSGNALNNVIIGNSGNNVLEGGSGNDALAGMEGTNVLIGGSGNDTMTATVHDIILLNKGDGQDLVTRSVPGESPQSTLSLGGALAYDDLAFSKVSDDLVLTLSSSDQIRFEDWYADIPSVPVLSLQVIAEAMAAFDAAGNDPLLDHKVERFDFTGLVNAFDSARAADASLSHWALANALANFQFAGSDTEALGGDLAYRYGRTGSLAAIASESQQVLLGSNVFGIEGQAWKPLAA